MLAIERQLIHPRCRQVLFQRSASYPDHMKAPPANMHRALAWLSCAGFVLAAILLGRLTFDLSRLHVVLAVCVVSFYVGFLAVVGSNVVHLLRGASPGTEHTNAARWVFVLAIPVALLASVLDCMGLDFVGCTQACGLLMKMVAPGVSLLAVLYAITRARAWILGAAVLAFGLLYPNCVCRNPVNIWWIDLLGRSPACFASSFGVFLLASTALATGRLVAPSLLLIWGIVAAQLAFWIGHHYFHVPW